MTELERGIGRPLVRRMPTGYRLTEFGQEMLPHAERVEQAVLTFEQRVEEDSRHVAGVLRVTCPEPIVYRITQSGLLDSFHTRYPALRIEFVMNDKYVDLAKGEADVALPSGDTDDGDLIGRKIADSHWAVYACRRYIEQHGKPERIEDLDRHRVVGFDETMANHRAAKWLSEVAPNAHVVARNNSMLGLVYSVKSGIGVAALPTALGNAEEDLVRVLGPIPDPRASGASSLIPTCDVHRARPHSSTSLRRKSRH